MYGLGKISSTSRSTVRTNSTVSSFTFSTSSLMPQICRTPSWVSGLLPSSGYAAIAACM